MVRLLAASTMGKPRPHTGPTTDGLVQFALALGEAEKVDEVHRLLSRYVESVIPDSRVEAGEATPSSDRRASPSTPLVIPVRLKGRPAGNVTIHAPPQALTPARVRVVTAAASIAALATAQELPEGTSPERSSHARKLEEELSARLEALASENRELDAFSATVAHDLRAPLQAVLRLTDGILRRPAASVDPQTRDDLEAVRASTLRMARLVEDLLDLARRSHGTLRRERFDLAPLARTLLADIAKSAPERRLRVIVEEPLPIAADPALVGILLSNLLANAWKFSARRPETSIHVGSRVVGGERAFFVRDEGVGFDPALAHRLFRPFERIDPSGEFEGTGVGLATSRRIVERHGGRIWAESKPGQGATFFFTLGEPLS